MIKVYNTKSKSNLSETKEKTKQNKKQIETFAIDNYKKIRDFPICE